MFDTYQVMLGESMFYRHQVYRQQVNGAEAITQELKEAREMIAHLKKKIHKDKAQIRELSEVIHEQNFLLQHNDQDMLELENQLEAVVAPPPEPAILEPEGEEDPEEIHGESGVEPDLLLLE
jgi:chromosome segregation ATPase